MKPDVSTFQAALRDLGAGGRLLVAVSGGADSMCLLHLAHASGIACGVAHIHYGLRGSDADADARLVESEAIRRCLPFYLFTCNEQETAKIRASNTQEKAREIRYTWLSYIARLHGYEHIATAHHADDQAETMVHHFLRGSGPAGLSGIAPVRGQLVRPLLRWSRQELRDFATEQALVWREDESNESMRYTRNRIRREVMPVLEAVLPGAAGRLAGRAALYHEVDAMIGQQLSGFLRTYLSHEAGVTTLDGADLAQYPYPRLLLAHWLMPLGFTLPQVEQVLLLRDPGTRVDAAGYSIWRDREAWCLTVRHAGEKPAEEWISEEARCVAFPIRSRIVAREEWTLDTSPSTAQFDADQLSFPVCVRSWREGDRIQPMGMEGSQPVSDLLIQRKVPAFLKAAVVVLEQEGKILWVAGYRRSGIAPITAETRRVWEVHIG